MSAVLALAFALSGAPWVAARPGEGTALEVLEAGGRIESLRVGGRVVEARVAPGGRRVAGLVATRQHGGLPVFELRVFDRKGELRAKVQNAQDFRFHPDGRGLAVVQGRTYEGGRGFTPAGVSLVNLVTGKEEVAAGLETARKIAFINRPGPDGKGTVPQLFAEVDGDPPIVRYDLQERKTYPTKLLGLECAPDGLFYYLTPRESARAGLCSGTRKGDRCVRAFSWKNEPTTLPADKRIDRPVTWTSGEGHEAVFMEGFGPSRRAVAVDLETGRLRPLKPRLDPTWQLRPGWVVTTRGRPRRMADLL